MTSERTTHFGFRRRIGAGLSLALATAAAVVFAAPADAVSLHALTPTNCISDIDFPQTCGGVDGGPNETEGLFFANSVAVSPDGRSVYVASGLDDAVVRFIRGADGSLTAAGCISDLDAAENCGGPNGGPNEAQGLNGAQGITVSPDGGSVYVAGTIDDTIVRFNRAADGSLIAAGCIEDLPVDAGCGAGTQGLDASGSPVVSPDGSSVYAVGGADSAIVRFDRAAGGALTPAGCISDIDLAQTCGGADGGPNEAEGLEGAQGLAVSPDGISVYTTSFTDSAIARFNRAPGGSLNAAGCISDTEGADTCGAGNETQGLGAASRVAVSPDGASVYATSPQDDAFVRFNRAPGGALSAAGCISDVDNAQTCGGVDGGPNEAQGLEDARGVTVSPDGESVFVASATTGSGAVARFDRSPNGALTSAGCFDDVFPPAICGAGNEIPGLSQAEAVAVSPNGASVYAIGGSSNAIVHFNREVPPVCLNTAASGPPDAQVTVPLDCFDPNGDALTIEPLDAPLNGTLGSVNQAADTVAYTPNAGFSGGDAFSYWAISDGKRSNVAGANLVIAPPQGEAGPAGSQGPQGPQGTPGEAAIKLLALLASDKLSAGSGDKLAVRFATSAGGEVELEVKQGSRVLISRSDRITDDGEQKLTLKLVSSKTKRGGKAKPLKPGNYTVVLTVTGTDGQTASDSARLRVRRG